MVSRNFRLVGASIAMLAASVVVGAPSPAAAAGSCEHQDVIVGTVIHDWRYHAYGKDYHKDQNLNTGNPAQWIAHSCGHSYS